MDAGERLIKLGDMMGDGLHHEPGGEWIEKEYKKVLVEMGIISISKRDTTKIDFFMQKRITEEKCECGGIFTQTRKGSFRVRCKECGKKWQLGGRKK